MERRSSPAGTGEGDWQTVCLSEPLVDGCDQHGRLVTDGQLVVPRGHRAMPFQAIDPALHCVAFLVVLLVEGRRPTAPTPELLSVANLVGLLRDGALDPASAQVGAVGARAVGFVGADLVRFGAWPSWPGAGNADAFEDWLELWAVVPVPGGDQERQRLLPLLGREVDLRGQAAAGAPEAVIVGLGVDPAGRLALQIPFLRAPAACWWARQTVESTLTSQVIRPCASARTCSCSRIRFQVPSRCQRRNRS